MKYAPVVELQLEHVFYTDRHCPDLAIALDRDTERLLAAHSCLVRTRPAGLHVIAALESGGQPLAPLPAGAALRFELRIADEDFALFTDLGALERTPSPCFRNAAGPSGELALATRTVYDPRTGTNVPAKQAPGVLAEIEIALRPDDLIGRTLPAAEFQITFESRLWRWAYYCITDLTASGGELTIIDSSSTPDAILFSNSNRTKLDEHPDPSDAIAVQIAAAHPDLRCVRFLSDQSIACRELPRTSLELRLDGDRVWVPLPNPSVRSFMRRGLAPPAGALEEQLFQIIEYRVQPFSHS